EASGIALNAHELGIAFEPERTVVARVLRRVAQQRARALEREHAARVAAEIVAALAIQLLGRAAEQHDLPVQPGLAAVAARGIDLARAAHRGPRVAPELDAIDHPAGISAQLHRLAQVDVERALRRLLG